MSDFKSIKNWNEDEKPREKMMAKGAAALADAELLAILLSTGTTKKSAVDLAREVLELSHGNLRDLGRLGMKELMKINGIGEAKAITICAAMELGRRRQVSESRERPEMSGSKAVAAFLMPLLQDLNHEEFHVLYLNQGNKVIQHERISSGGWAGTIADMRIILKSCLLNNCSQMIVAHNHPSGNLRASEADIELTKRLRDAARMMDIKLLDHIIIAGDKYLSLSDSGVI